MFLDTQFVIHAPEGVALPLRAAGMIPRCVAYIIDMLVRLGIGILILVAIYFMARLLSLGELYIALTYLIIFFITMLYPIMLEAMFQGRTVGKYFIGLQAVNSDGTHLNWGSSSVRNLLRMADFLPFGFFLGILCAHITTGHRRFGDICADTVVIYVPKKVKKINKKKLAKQQRMLAKQKNTPSTLKSDWPQPVPCPVGLEPIELKAVLNFHDRWHQLSKDRRIELAMSLHHIHKLKGEAAAQRIRAWALYFLGEEIPSAPELPKDMRE